MLRWLVTHSAARELLLIVMIFVLSLLKSPIAWGGILLSALGFITGKRTERSDPGDIRLRGKTDQTNTEFSLFLKGNAGIFVIVGGIIIAIVGISLQTPSASRDSNKKIDEWKHSASGTTVVPTPLPRDISPDPLVPLLGPKCTFCNGTGRRSTGETCVLCNGTGRLKP
jgi:hypothetical protein